MNEALKGRPAAWIAPSYKYLLPNWRSVSDVLRPVITSKSEEEKHIEIQGGGQIDFWSADGAAMPGEGRNYGMVVIDEAAMLGADLERIWTRSLRPTLTDLMGGSFFLSTSKAASSYFSTLFGYGQGEREDWKSWQLGTADNPLISPEEIESARCDMSAAAFAQEYLGDAVSFSGAVFTNLEKAILDESISDVYEGWHPWSPSSTYTLEFFIGADWAGAGRRATGDFTAFIVLASDGTVCAIERFKADFSLQRTRLQGLVSRFRPAAIIAEQNGIGAPQISELRKSGLQVQSFNTTNSTKHAAVEALALGFEEGKIKIPNLENQTELLAELMAFEAIPLPNGLTRFAAASGGHDDLVIAMMLAWQAANRPMGGGWRTE